MDHQFNTFLFGIYPYLCLTVFVVGTMIRYDREQYSWKASSSQMLSDKGLWLGNNLFHVGILLLLMGHLFGLLTPHSVYEKFISVEHKQLVAMIAGGVFGTLCFIGLTILIFRRLFNARIRLNSRPSDIAILMILYIQLLLGLYSITISAQHLDGSSMVNLAHWAQGIVTFQSGTADHVLDEHLVFKLHILLGMTIFLLFPFTRLVHALSVPIKYFFRTGYQIVRRGPGKM
jgi:nitrate reductase gamma subunit